MEPGVFLLGLGFLAACSGSAPKTLAKLPDGGRVPVTLTAANRVINLGASNNDVVVNSATEFVGVDALVQTGSGNDTIVTSTGNDRIRAGAGNDIIMSGAGDDIIIIIGANNNNGNYTTADLAVIQDLATLAQINNKNPNDASGQKTIDGGSGFNKLIIFGNVDLSQYTITNIGAIDLHSELTIQASQLTNQNIRSISGNGDAVVNIASNQLVYLDIGILKFITNIEQLQLGQNVVLVIKNDDELTQLTNQISIISGVGRVLYSSDVDISALHTTREVQLWAYSDETLISTPASWTDILETSTINNNNLINNIASINLSTQSMVMGVFGNDYITLLDSTTSADRVFIDVLSGKNIISFDITNKNFLQDTIIIRGIDANDKIHLNNIGYVVLDYGKSAFNKSQYYDVVIFKDNQGNILSNLTLGTKVFSVSSLSQQFAGDGTDVVFRTQPIFDDYSVSFRSIDISSDPQSMVQFSPHFPADPGRNPLTISVTSTIAEGSLTYNDGRTVKLGDIITINELLDMKYYPLAGSTRGDLQFTITATNSLGISKRATINLTPKIIAGDGAVTGTNLADNLNYTNSSNALVINGLNGDDMISGTSLSDIINGGAGADRIFALAGNDTILADLHDKLLDGGSGTDSVTLSNSTAVTLHFTTNAQSQTSLLLEQISLANVEFISLQGASNTIATNGSVGGNINLALGQYFTANNGYFIEFSGVDNIVAGSGNDIITGNNNNNRINGGAGADIINAGEGDDWVIGQLGDTSLTGGAGMDTIDLSGESADMSLTLTNGSEDSASISGRQIKGFENIIAGSGNDFLRGNNLNNILNGGAGNDIIIASGADILIGGAGNDILVADSQTLSIQGGDGIDTVNFSLVANQSVTITLNNNGDGLAIIADDTQSAVVSLSGIENITGGALADTITGNGQNNILRGGGGSDKISAGAGDDIIMADENDALLDGGDGNDWLDFSDNSTRTLQISMVASGYFAISQDNTPFEEFISITNFENIRGGGNDDVINGNVNDNKLAGGGGSDTLWGGDGNDWIYGDFSDTNIDGGDGLNTIDFSDMDATHSLTITFSQSSITILDGTASNSANITNFINAVGGLGNDTLVGDAQNNTLNGNNGADNYQAGAGNDIIIVDEADKNINGGADGDTIDFNHFSLGITLNLAVTGSQTLHNAQSITMSITNIEHANGTNFDDIISGSSLVNIINGGAGNDVVFLQLNDVGYDIIDGGAGNDWVNLSQLDKFIATNIRLNQDTTFISASYDYQLASASANSLSQSITLNTLNNSMNLLRLDKSATTNNVNLRIINENQFALLDGNGISATMSLSDWQGVLDKSFITGKYNIATSYNSAQKQLLIDLDNNPFTNNSISVTLSGTYSFTTFAFANNTLTVDFDGQASTTADRVSLTTDSSFVYQLLSPSQVVGAMAHIENIWGSSGADTIYGDSVANQIYAGAGLDTIFGGGGDDIIYITRPDLVTAAEYFDGESGQDTISFKYVTSERILIQLGEANGVFARLRADSTNSLTLNNTFNQDWYNIQILQIENITGGAGFDYIIGNSINNILNGGDGNDILYTGGGNDTILGGNGDDNFYTGGRTNLGNPNAEIFVLEDSSTNMNFYRVDFAGGRDGLMLDYTSITKNLTNDILVLRNFNNDDVIAIRNNISATGAFGPASNTEVGYFGDEFIAQNINVNVDGVNVITLRTDMDVSGRVINVLYIDTNFDNIADTSFFVFGEYYNIINPGVSITDITNNLSLTQITGTVGNDFIVINDTNSNNLQKINLNLGAGGIDWLRFNNLPALYDNSFILTNFGRDDRLFFLNQSSTKIIDGFFRFWVDGDGLTSTTSDRLLFSLPLTPRYNITNNSTTTTLDLTLVNTTSVGIVESGASRYNLFTIGRNDDPLNNPFIFNGVSTTSLTPFKLAVNGGAGSDFILMSIANLQGALENISGNVINPFYTWNSTTQIWAIDLDGNSATNSTISVTFSSTFGPGTTFVFNSVNGNLTVDYGTDAGDIDRYTFAGGAILGYQTPATPILIDSDKNGSIDSTIYTFNSNLFWLDNNIINTKSTVNIHNSGTFVYDGGSGSDGVDFSIYNSQVSLTLDDSASTAVYLSATIIGSVQNAENISGTDYNDYFVGNNASNAITGRAGNDIIRGGGGADILIGGEGNDSITADQFDTILSGGNGVDTLEFSDNTTRAIRINLNTGSSLASYALSPDFSSTIFTDLSETVSISGFENITGGGGNDFISGSSLANIIIGGSGVDNLFGDAGDDIVFYTQNDSNLDGGTGIDTINFSLYNDNISVVMSQTTAYSLNSLTSQVTIINFENIITGSGADIIFATTGANIINTSSGNDIIHGFGGADNIDGGLGDDIIFVGGSETSLNGNLGYDTLDFSDYAGRISLTFASFANNATTNSITNNIGASILNFENINGSSLSDYIFANADNNILQGGGGNDILFGGLGSNTIAGGQGSDRIISNGGVDIIYGGDNNNPNGDNANDVFVWQRNGFVLESLQIMDFERDIDKVEFANGPDTNASETDFGTRVAHQMGFDHLGFGKFVNGNNSAYLEVLFYNSPADADPATTLQLHVTNVSVTTPSAVDSQLLLTLLGNNGYIFS